MKKRRAWLWIAVALAVFLPGLPAAAEELGLAGHWTGILELPSMKLDFDLDFTLKEGVWTGNVSIPAQKAKDLPLEKIVLMAKEATFAISGIPGDPTFKGTLSDDGTSLKGTMTQAGQTFPFSAKRGESPAAKASAALAGFDEVVNRGLKNLNVPGASIAVVVGDAVILAKGYGYRDIEAKKPMTADTLLAIGSASKAFTTFALGALAEEGKMEWDEPVRTYIPWFKLYDPSASERLTPRDLVTHRSGLPRHDLVWYNNLTATREELVRRLAYLQPTADLRERFQYNNLMFLTAGYLLEVLTGSKWEEAVRAKVLAPLGMDRTNFSVEDSQKDADFALPYLDEKGAFKRIPFRNITTVGPAGAINSSANEMSRWVRVHLNNGRFNGQPVISEAAVEDMHLAHMPMGVPQALPEITPSSYGLGWFLDSYRGRVRVHHGGNIDGFSAMVSFFPQDGIGFVVLTNMDGTALGENLIRHAADRILGFPARDWIAEAAEARAKGEDTVKEAESKKATRRTPGTKPAHKLEDYAGEYFHPGYGDLKVILKDKQFVFEYNGIFTKLEHWHYETFAGIKIGDPTFENTKITFRTDSNGHVAGLEIPIEPTLKDIVFERKPEARFFDPAYLQTLTGRYDMGTQRLTVTLKGTTLVVSIPGQAPLELVPALGGEFVIKQMATISLRFKTDDKGRVTALEAFQPQGVFEAKKIQD